MEEIYLSIVKMFGDIFELKWISDSQQFQLEVLKEENKLHSVVLQAKH